MEQEPQLNAHNKQEYPPMHTAEHLLNALMVKTFGCERSRNAHIERRKSKISYDLATPLTEGELAYVVNEMNRLVDANLPVTVEYVTADQVPEGVRLDRLPDDVSDTLRLVRIGDYDVCPCAGLHVSHTRQIGRFVLLGTNWDEEKHSFRIRFKLEAPAENA